MQTETKSTFTGSPAINRLQETILRQQRELHAKELRERRILTAVRQTFGPDGFDLIQRIINS